MNQSKMANVTTISAVFFSFLKQTKMEMLQGAKANAQWCSTKSLSSNHLIQYKTHIFRMQQNLKQMS